MSTGIVILLCVVALVLGAGISGVICFKQGVGEVYVFANTCERVKGLSSHSTVMDIVERIKSYRVGGGTYLDVALKTITADSVKGAKYDNLILLSDNDCYTSSGTTFRINGWGTGNADDTINSMIRNKVIKKFYLNNLLGNKFAIVNTDDYRKNLITGFSERIVEVINIYGAIGKGASDIRVVIDKLMDSLK